jgi:hypothetical protein
MKNFSLRVLLAFSTCLIATSIQAQSGPTLDISPVLVDFGETAEGGRGRQNLTLTNLTDAPLDVTAFDQTGSASFAIDPLGGGKPCGAETPRIEANDNCTLEVIFTPDFPEVANGTLTFTPNGDPTKAITVRLKGETPDQGGGCSLQVRRRRP